jgi:phytoene dehydrogenase-like protein
MKHQPKVFDVMILGAGLGGLIAANRLTDENRSVLLLKEAGYHSSYTRDGYRFFPFSNFSEKRIKTGLLKKISHWLEHQKDQTKGDPSEQDLSFQVILPESRIDLYRDPSLLHREWRREFPDELRQIESFYAELRQVKRVLEEIKRKAAPEDPFPICESSFFKRWLSFDGLPKGGTDQRLSSFSPPFKKWIELQMISYGYLCSDSFPVPLMSHLLIHDHGDEFEESIDLERMEQGMIGRFTRSGGSLKEIEGIEKVEMKRRGEISLSLKGEGQTLRSRTLLLNAPLHRLSNPFGKTGKALSKGWNKVHPRYVLVPFCLGINERVIPVGMRNLLVSLSNLEKSYEGGNLLFLSLSRKGDERQAPEGKRALMVQCFMPYGEARRDSLSGLQEGMMNHLKDLFPFLDHHLEFIDRKWAEDHMDRWSYPHYYDEVDSNYQWRRGIVPIRRTKHLYYSGKENFPYLGLEGVILSGFMCAEEILKGLR